MDNCVSCCTRCNMDKKTLTLPEFREWVSAVIHFVRKGGNCAEL